MADDDRAVNIRADISGTNEGNIAVGTGIDQHLTRTTIAGPTEEQLRALAASFADLRATIERDAPPELRERALERADELEAATVTDEPDVSVMAAARRWFVERLPQIAGAVTSVIVHPTVGRIVEAAGERIAREYRERFPEAPPLPAEPAPDASSG
jgi:hypothetical protein